MKSYLSFSIISKNSNLPLKQNLTPSIYQQIIIIADKMIKTKRNPCLHLSYHRQSQPVYNSNSKYIAPPKSRISDRGYRLNLQRPDHQIQGREKQGKQETLQTASTPRVNEKQRESLDETRWWFKSSRQQGLQYLIRRQRQKNNRLRQEIEWQKSNHNKRMQMVKSQINGLNAQYNGYDTELSEISKALHRMGL